MTHSQPFRLMRMRINLVTVATAKLVTLAGFPDDKTYLALTYGMMDACGKNRQLTRVQIEARLVAWVMHFEKGVGMLPEAHEGRSEMVEALGEFKKWVRLPAKETA